MQYPTNKRAIWPLIESQVAKLAEEVAEVNAEVRKPETDWDALVEELCDVEHVLYGIFDALPYEEVERGRGCVVRKNAGRGDYFESEAGAL